MASTNVGSAIGEAQARVFVRDLLMVLAARFMEIARRKTDSETIKRTLYAQLDPVTGTAFVISPQYWAVYYHDGRGPVRPKSSKFIVFYRDRRDDPRKPSETMRAFQINRLKLSPIEFSRKIKDGSLIMRKEVGPAPAHPYFLQAHDEFARPGALDASISEALTEHLMKDFVRSETATAHIHL